MWIVMCMFLRVQTQLLLTSIVEWRVTSAEAIRDDSKGDSEATKVFFARVFGGGSRRPWP